MPVYLLLYGVQDADVVFYDSQRHALVSAQFIVSGIMLSAAFILLGTVIYVAQERDKWIGIFGLALIGLWLPTGILAGILKTKLWKWFSGSRKKSGTAAAREARTVRDGTPPTTRQQEKPNRWIWPSMWRATPVVLVQLTLVSLLLGFGGRSASRAEHQDGCHTAAAAGANAR